jgi:hypothetical protein
MLRYGRDIDHTPRYHTQDDPMPLDAREVRRAQPTEPEERSPDIHIHLHGPGESEADPLAKLAKVVDGLCGPADNRRRQHSRDSRSVPSVSEFSSAYFPNRSPTLNDLLDPCGLPAGNVGPRPSQMVLDGARALRGRSIMEMDALADLNDLNRAFWDAEYERRKR